MRALLYKDLIALKKTLLLLVLFVFIVTAVFAQQGELRILPLIFILIPVILLGILFGTDAQSKADQYIIPGPLKRSTIVLSRYAFSWIIAVIGIVVSLGLNVFLKETLLGMPWYLLTPALLLVLTIVPAIQIPLMYKLGLERARIAFVIIYFIVFGLFSYAGDSAHGIRIFVEQLQKFDLRLISLGFLAITLILNFASFGVATAFYKNKEF